MKKLLLLALTISAMGLLSGCDNNGGKPSFQNFKFDEELQEAEKDTIIRKVRNELADNAISVVAEGSSKTEYKNYKSESKSKTTLKLFDSYHIHREHNGETSYTVNALSWKTKQSSVSDRFDDTQNKAIVSLTHQNELDTETYSVTNYSQDENVSLNVNALNDALAVAVPLNSQKLTAYKDGKNYALAYSTIRETYTPVAWGDSYKESISKTRSQMVVKLDSNYRITSCYQFSDNAANQDPNTNEWYKKVQTLSTGYIKYTIKYGTRSSGDSEKQNVLNKFNYGYIDSYTFGADGLTWALTSTNVTPSSVHIKTSASINYLSRYFPNGSFLPSLSLKYYSSIGGLERTESNVNPDFTVDEGSGLQKEDLNIVFPLDASATGYSLSIYFEFDININDNYPLICNAVAYIE